MIYSSGNIVVELDIRSAVLLDFQYPAFPENRYRYTAVRLAEYLIKPYPEHLYTVNQRVIIM
jgi:hypothetical protein